MVRVYSDHDAAQHPAGQVRVDACIWRAHHSDVRNAMFTKSGTITEFEHLLAARSLKSVDHDGTQLCIRNIKLMREPNRINDATQ